MGMYDDITVKVPLEGTTRTTFQTKSLVNWLDNYEIREDGTLWHEEYETVDRSDPNAEGIRKLAGIMTRINQWWHREVTFTGEIRFGYWDNDEKKSYDWVTFFVKGEMKVGPIRVE